MKANELRLKNIVEILGNPVPIDLTILTCIIQDQRFAKPIHLTEEWLVKFGFEKDMDDLILDINTMLFVSYNDDEFVHIKSNNLETILSIQYVHQLQNLYFALTGEELEIKS